MDNKSHILVLNRTGFIGAHVVDELLKQGYRVRATIRSTAKGEHLKNVFKDAGDKLSFVIVEDLQKVSLFRIRGNFKVT